MTRAEDPYEFLAGSARTTTRRSTTSPRRCSRRCRSGCASCSVATAGTATSPRRPRRRSAGWPTPGSCWTASSTRGCCARRRRGASAATATTRCWCRCCGAGRGRPAGWPGSAPRITPARPPGRGGGGRLVLRGRRADRAADPGARRRPARRRRRAGGRWARAVLAATGLARDVRAAAALSGLLQVLEGDQERATQILTDAENRLAAVWPPASRYDLLVLRAWAAARGWRDPGRCWPTWPSSATCGSTRRTGGRDRPGPGVAAARPARHPARLARRPQAAARLLAAAVRSGRGRAAPAGPARGVDPGGTAARRCCSRPPARPGPRRRSRRRWWPSPTTRRWPGQYGAGRLAAAWSAYLRGLPAGAHPAGPGRDRAGRRRPAGAGAARRVLRARLVLPTEGPAAARAALRVGRPADGAPDSARALAGPTPSCGSPQ